MAGSRASARHRRRACGEARGTRGMELRCETSAIASGLLRLQRLRVGRREAPGPMEFGCEADQQLCFALAAFRWPCYFLHERLVAANVQQRFIARLVMI